ncbi:MAG: hypothetical protein ACK51K_14390 [Gammaproteobacteria bacterium]
MSGATPAPQTAPGGDWREACAAAGVDPLLIDHTARNYLAHRDHRLATGGRPLPPVDWFRFYSLENAAELSSETLKVEGCSVDERAVRPPTAAGKAALFALLQLRLAQDQDDV